MARRVDKGDCAAILLDAVGADALRDAALFARHHVDSDNPVQQRRLAVVDVAQERDDWGTRLQQRRVFFLVLKLGQNLVLQLDMATEIDFHREFHGKEFRHFRIELRVDVQGRARSKRKQFGQNAAGGHADGFGEGPHRARQLDDDVAFPRRGRVCSRAVNPPQGASRSLGFFL